MPARCLIIGARGQLGRALCAELRPRYEVIEAGRHAARTGQWQVDLADAVGTAGAIRKLRPDWIFNAGAYCNVDGAETERAHCFRVNAEGPAAVAEAAQAYGAVMVHFSTDTVFDGTREGYAETDPVSPVNTYSRSKADGERAVREQLPEHHLIIRTAWLYGPDEAKKNFVFRLIGELKAGRSVAVPEDQRGCPTYTDDLAAAARVLVERGQRGTFHATGPEFVDRTDFARRICAVFGLDAGGIRPVATAELGQAARRPLRVWLDCQKLQASGVGPFRGIDAGLTALRAAVPVTQDA